MVPIHRSGFPRSCAMDETLWTLPKNWTHSEAFRADLEDHWHSHINPVWGAILQILKAPNIVQIWWLELHFWEGPWIGLDKFQLLYLSDTDDTDIRNLYIYIIYIYRYTVYIHSDYYVNIYIYMYKNIHMHFLIDIFIYLYYYSFHRRFLIWTSSNTCQLPTSDKSTSLAGSHNMASSNPKKDRKKCFQDGSSMMCPSKNVRCVRGFYRFGDCD